MKGSATILIVEDSPTQAEYLSAILEDRGFQVVTTRNGEEALASMAKRRPDLVISDVTMPGIDGFEHVNDTLGHDAGDELLRATGAILISTFREMDVIGRIGGDEFAVLFPCLLPDGVMAVLYRLEQNLARYRAESELAQKLSFSIGTATFDPTDEVSLADLLKRADEDMYSTRNAKNGGSKPRAQRASQGHGAS